MPSQPETGLPASPLAAGSPPRVPTLLFGAAILLGALLLFQVEPLIAKLILPWFGGSAAVWTSCLLFFQLTLLAGYAYSHWLSRQEPFRQAIVHVALLALSFLSLPILPAPASKPQGGEDPLLHILGLLSATVGLPWFLLSSTSPLLQSWYSRSQGGAVPYRFFALSNAGSMIGLLTYPVLVEPYLTNRQQAWMWSMAYCVFATVCAVVAWMSWRARPERVSVPASPTAPPRVPERLLWMALAACASALLLAVTNHLTGNIAAIPFLWVLPLSLYLLSFVLCFDSQRWYRRWLFVPLAAVSLPAMVYVIAGSDRISDLEISDLRQAIGLLCAAMFAIFMMCHGELARRRPPAEHLTSFYLMVSAGGALGSLFIALAAPWLFDALYDLPVVLSLTGFLMAGLFGRGRGRSQAPPTEARRKSGPVSPAPSKKPGGSLDAPHDRPVVLVLVGSMVAYAAVRAAGFGGPRFPGGPYDTAVLLLLMGCLAVYLLWRTRNSAEARMVRLTVAAGLAAGFAGILARETWHSVAYARVRARNFYGALVVYDDFSPGAMGPVRVLRHGAIVHGEQFLWAQNQRYPTTYYARNSGVGRAIQALMPHGAMNVGVIGLGAGTMAAYARPADRYCFYDIDPNVVKIAGTQFTFLHDSPGPHQVIPGDARLSLERERSRQFDLLAVDAFSGDAIPVHLLTREAFRLYWRHLKPDGVLAVHVSNKYLALGPVVAMAALESNKRAMMFTYDGNEAQEEFSSDWVLVTSRPGFFDLPDILPAGRPIDPIPGLRMWTDDYSNLYRILR